MAIIPQINLFSWNTIQARSDLDRLRYVLKVIPDEPLMRILEKERGRGRNDYPVRAVWNSLLSAIVYQHDSIASLRRELSRNGELRQLCGFDVASGDAAVPPDWVFSRFIRNLYKHLDEVESMFDQLVEMLRSYLPDLGTHLAIDSKAVDSAGRPTRKKAVDGRRDIDADWGAKTYRGVREDGSLWEKIKHWFGYKLHLIVDAVYELPVAYKVTRASTGDCPQLLPMVKHLKQRHSAMLERTESMAGDKGYDSKDNNAELYDEYAIKPLLDAQQHWRDTESRLLFSDRADNIVADERGTVFCVAYDSESPEKLRTTPMSFCGFEPKRRTLKYRCPAAVYGYHCPERETCSPSSYGRVVQVPLEEDRRRFVPVPRASCKWERLFKQRTAIERVNSRLGVSFGFGQHFVRGIKKMKLKSGLALVVMLAMALGSLKAGCQQNMRSLVWSGSKKLAA